AFTLPLILLLVVFSQTVMGLFGAEFQAGSVVFAILCLGQLANVGTGSVGTLLFMSGNQNKMLPVQIVVAVLALLGNVILVPLLGIKAAALVAVLSVAATNVSFLVIVRHKMQLFPYNASYVRLIIPIAATATTIWALHTKLAGIVPAVPLLLAVFVLAYA